MGDRYDTDVMDDRFYEAAEGPSALEGFEDEFEGEGFEDEFEDEFEEDGFEAFDEGDGMDALEEAVVDALAAEDADEFLRRLRRGLRTAGQVARRVAPVVGRIARTVAPIASAIPLPWTQAVGRVANVVGRVMADEGDEFEALDEMLELAEEEDLLDAAAPVVAGLTLRRTVPGVARMPRPLRRQLVRSVTRATQTIARRQGVQAARAVPGVVRAARRTAANQGQPARALPGAVARTAARVARSPRLTQQLARTVPAAARRVPGAIAGGGACPNCRRRRGGGRNIVIRGPVRILVGNR